MKLSLIASSLIVSLATVGCQQQQPAPHSAASATPTLTSSPVAPPEHPGPPSHAPGHPGSMGPGPGHHPPPSPGGPRWHGGEENIHVYKFDFVLTPKDPKDATLTPTSFTINIPENNSGEVTIGRNVALQPGVTAPVAGGGPAVSHASPRQDVGLKVKAHPRGLPNTEDMVLDVTLEMSSVEGQTNGAASIRKLTTQGSAVVALGKSALIMSVDDAQKHYELTVTATKLR